jgi:hypothetical protein
MPTPVDCFRVHHHYTVNLTHRSRIGSPLFGENETYFAEADFAGAKSLGLRL